MSEAPKSMNLPNQITLGRLGLCALFVVVLSMNWQFSATIALAIFLVAGLTDWVDGEIARRMGLVTDLGKLLDPLADKVLISAALVALITYGLVEYWMVMAIISREFLITGLRILGAGKGRVLAAERAGKHKTISQMVAIITSFVLLAAEDLGFKDSTFANTLESVIPWLFWLATAITIISGGYYLWKNRSLLETDPVPPPIPQRAQTGHSSAAEILSPAFKEWSCIVEALGKGRQVLILRKGGIAEGREGFKPAHSRFWLFPTNYHQQREKTKPEAAGFIHGDPIEGFPAEVRIEYLAEVVEARYLNRWDEIEGMDSFHLWKPEVIRERFGYGGEEGMHLLLIRVYRLKSPVVLPWRKSFEGCKSWIEIPVPLSGLEIEPVLGNAEFETCKNAALTGGRR